MFKPQNPKLNALIVELNEIIETKRNLDNEIIDLPFIYSEAEDLEKDILSIDKKIASLTHKRENKVKKLTEFKAKLEGKNITQLRKNSNTLGEKIQDKETEIQRIVDEDFKSFINNMTEENTMECYLFSGTSTTPIMDKFYNDKDKDFLVLNGIFHGKDLVITKKYKNITVADVLAPTITELKTFRPSRIPERMRPLWNIISQYDNSKLKLGQKVQFDIPLPLGGQTYANQTGFGGKWDWTDGYGSYTEGTYYGEVTTFLIIGFIRNF